MKQMAKRDPLAWMPGDRFLYADDALRLSWREVAQIALGAVGLTALFFFVMFLVSVSGPALS
jgi:hypothetical protein